MNNPLVSVIIPNYNHAKFLDERIQSVLNQTYQNFEVIILDDKSTDNSVELINQYKDNPHISHIVVNNENSGSTFKQWHKGFELAKGELIWIAESDDLCSHNFLEKLVSEFMRDTKCVLSFCRSVMINSDGVMTDIYPSQKYKNSRICMQGRDFIAKEMKFVNLVCNASSAIFKKDVLQEIEKDYMNYQGCGDWLFWIYLSEQGNVIYIPEIFNYFRMHEGNTTAKHNKDGVNDHEQYLIAKYMLDKKYICKMEFVHWGLLRYAWHKRSCPFLKDSIFHNYKKEWKISFIYDLFIIYNRCLGLLSSLVHKLMI